VNGAQLEAWVSQNQKALLGVGAAGAVGFGLYKRHQAKQGDVGADPAAAQGTAAGLALPYSAGGQTAGVGSTYDSSASDLFGAVSPLLESLGNQLTGVMDKLNQAPPTPVPAPVLAPQPGPAPAPAPAPVAAPPPPPVPVPSGYNVDQWYTIRPGDTLSGIAARFPQQSITARSIFDANRGVIGGNINLIRPGQVVHIFGN
jgi:hypothetical protein